MEYVISDSIFGDNYVLDDRQFYFMKKVSKQLDPDIVSLVEYERGLEKRSDDFCSSMQRLEESGVLMSSADDYIDPDLDAELDYYYKDINPAIRKTIREQIKQMVENVKVLPEFDLDYCGVMITDIEYKSVLKLSDDTLIPLVDRILNPSNGGGLRGVTFLSPEGWQPTALTKFGNWKDFVTDNDLDTDDLKQCDANFWKGYHQLKLGTN